MGASRAEGGCETKEGRQVRICDTKRWFSGSRAILILGMEASYTTTAQQSQNAHLHSVRHHAQARIRVGGQEVEVDGLSGAGVGVLPGSIGVLHDRRWTAQWGG